MTNGSTNHVHVDLDLASYDIDNKLIVIQ